MNKYLLLRDNKQSGPYTVPEIIELGIKPYDLVWLDGKSVAWRYPSEIEELKAYSPTVEEQPFDRFYKKPEQVIKPAPAVVQSTEHLAYVPKTETAEEEEIPVQKKVYINFPVGNAPAKKTVPEKKVYIPEPVQTVQQPISFTEKTNQPVPERISSYNSKPATDRKYVYYAGAACVILIGLIAMLWINNNTQQERLKELNTIVKEIENKKANDLTMQTTQVKNVEPAPVPQTSETIVNPELLSTNDYNTPVKPAVNETPAAAVEKVPAPKKADQPAADASGVVFKERPVLRRSDNDQATVITNKNENADPATPSSDNLFKQVSVKTNKYKTGVLGGISNLQLELTNNSKRELHKVAIQIKYLGPEKKVVNTQTVYFENVAPGEHTTIDVPKSKRGVTIDYIITDIKS